VFRAACRRLVEKPAVYEQLDGGWGYYDFNAQTYHPSFTSMSFTTATILLGIDRVRQAGIAADPRCGEPAPR
jgi:hypothetical protein